jgi:hypothetical protein
MHRMQTRIGALMVVTGSALTFGLAASWAVVVGSALLVIGGMVLAIAVEPALRLEDQTAPAEDVSEVVDRQVA